MSLNDFYANGQWDCSHAFEAYEFRIAWVKLGRPSDPEAAINVVRAVMSADGWSDCDEWIDQQTDGFDGLRPIDCYAAWFKGWQDKAIGYVRHYMKHEWDQCWSCGKHFLTHGDNWQDYARSESDPDQCWSCSQSC